MKTFEFTGFAAADLFEEGAIHKGASFTMPAAATLTISVMDDDARLSGDVFRNERGDDRSGQKASILSHGEEVGTGGKLYAENTWHLRGDDGRVYRLVELEQPGNQPDSFTFLGAVPSAGVTLTVGRASNVFFGVDYAHLSAGDVAPNIVEIATGSSDFDILEQALIAADLVSTVQQAKDITVFAPTDAAFTALAVDLGFDGDTSDEGAVFGFIAGALADLNEGDPIPLLKDILLYHVSPGAKSAADVAGAAEIDTLLTGAMFAPNGKELVDGEPDISNANVQGEAIVAANGNILVIDKVLIPIDIPGNTPAAPNIVDIAAGSEDFGILVKALEVTNLDAAVRGSDDITVFAPTDAAFGKLAFDLGFRGDVADEDAVFGFIAQALGTLASDGNPIPLLADILLYHVSPGAKTAGEVAGSSSVNTLLNGATFAPDDAELVDNEPDIDNPTVQGDAIEADNGNILVIDKVLIPIDIPGNGPTEPPTPTIAGIVAASGGTFDDDATDFDLLLTAVQTAGLAGALDDPEADLTVFAPTDAAFVGLSQALGFKGADEGEAFTYLVEALTLLGGGDPIPLLTEVLTYHVAPGAQSAATLEAAESIATLQGGTLSTDGSTIVDADPDVADPAFVAKDVDAANGIVQVIDGVLLPADLLASDGSNNVDFVIANDTRNIIHTGRDNDFVDGNAGNDILKLGRGDDVGLGGDGRDVIFGGKGEDVIVGGADNDRLIGGSDADTFVFNEGDGHDRIIGFDKGEDLIDLSGTTIESFAEIEDQIQSRFFSTKIDLGDDGSITINQIGLTLDQDDFLF